MARRTDDHAVHYDPNLSPMLMKSEGGRASCGAIGVIVTGYPGLVSGCADCVHFAQADLNKMKEIQHGNKKS